MSNNKEFKGYKILIGNSLKLNRFFKKIAVYFSNHANNFKFEQFKILFGERNDDIYISTYPKSGTTVMQVIIYQLTTDGSMDFDHIYDVSPWLRNLSYKGLRPPELPSPRILKTHDNYNKFSHTQGKIIYVYRDGMDVAVSHYYQEKNYNSPDLKFETYLKRFFKTKQWFKHNKYWFKNSKKLPILYVRYEDLLNDKRTVIENIIHFLNLNVTEEAISRALHYSSFEYMKKNEHLFGDKAPKKIKKVYNQFIRKGRSGEGKAKFSNEQVQIYKENYNKILKNLESKTFK